jgi:hypothetical protein
LTPAIAVAAGVVLLAAAIVLVPRRLVARAQDRLARERVRRLEEEGRRFRLLTRAERVAGLYRRVPGVLGLTDDALSFEGLFGESFTLATSRIGKIVTGNRLASGRTLFRLEALRLTATSGEESEFVLSRASADAWRSHLGLWAMKERGADAERVVPGR